MDGSTAYILYYNFNKLINLFVYLAGDDYFYVFSMYQGDLNSLRNCNGSGAWMGLIPVAEGLHHSIEEVLREDPDPISVRWGSIRICGMSDVIAGFQADVG